MRLRELREARGLSQEKVLFETNIHLSNIENGRQDITIATLVELCSLPTTSTSLSSETIAWLRACRYMSMAAAS